MRSAAPASHARNLGSEVATSIPSFTSAPLAMGGQQGAPLPQLSGLAHAYGALYEGLNAGIADTPRSPPDEAAAAAPTAGNGSVFSMQLGSSMALPAPLTLPPPLGLPQMMRPHLLMQGECSRVVEAFTACAACSPSLAALAGRLLPLERNQRFIVPLNYQRICL